LPPRAVAVAIASPGPGTARIVVATQRIYSLALQRLLNDQPGRQPDQLRMAPVLRLVQSLYQRLQLLACLLRCRYSFHRGARLLGTRSQNRTR
jgi:hypothetical protein